jgi:hypothetical protein
MRWRGLAITLLVALAGVAAGCGGTAASSKAGGTTYAVETVEVQTAGAVRHCDGLEKAKQARQGRLLQRDLKELRAAAKTMKKYSEDGTPAMNRALDRFSLDIAKEALPAYARSRFIDRAAGIVGPLCFLCFQTLEDNRPVAAGAKLPCD